MVSRILRKTIEQHLYKGKAILVTGARQVGKTTLVREIAASSGRPWLYWNCDEPDIESFLQRPNSAVIRDRIGNHTLVVIDEAQRVHNIGVTLKLIIDQIHDVQLLVTGSSALGLHDSINEPLTGRKVEFHLHPFTFAELVSVSDEMTEVRLLEQRLIYGMYPEIVLGKFEKSRLLTELTGDYLYKDILSLDSVRKPTIIPKLLQAISLQITNEISLTELGEIAGCDRNTVVKYIDLLEKAFVIFTLPALSRNPRNEIKKSRKIYFWDNGIRNALINQFNSLDLRDDRGKLWENYMTSEFLKRDLAMDYRSSYYFWRNHQQKEIDLVREAESELTAFEFKYGSVKKPHIPHQFTQEYAVKSYEVVNPENFYTFLR